MAPRVAYICLGCLHANYTHAKGRNFFCLKMVELHKFQLIKTLTTTLASLQTKSQLKKGITINESDITPCVK